MKVGVITGGGDCPGLNAVIRAIVRKAHKVFGDEVFGFYDGWRFAKRYPKFWRGKRMKRVASRKSWND